MANPNLTVLHERLQPPQGLTSWVHVVTGVTNTVGYKVADSSVKGGMK